MSENLQRVLLRNGTYDGQPAEAPPPPRTLTLGVRNDANQMSWHEVYVHSDRTEEFQGETLPVMLMVKRIEVPPTQ